MFGIKHNEFVGFESRWKVKRVFYENSTQTEECTVAEKGTTSALQTDEGAQTEENMTEEENSVATCDENKLAEWLKKIYPLVKRELDEASNSQAFKGYNLFDNNEEPYCKLIQSLSVKSNTETQSEEITAIDVSLICWSPSGKTLALSCSFPHKNWCCHTGCVKIYMLTKDEKISAKPKNVLTTDGCVTSFKFHPKHASVLAASTYTGVINIWNVQSEEDNVIFQATIHEQAINQISWVNDVDVAKTILLATCSDDTYLKLWNFNMNASISNALSLKARYKIKPPLFSGYDENAPNPLNKIDRSIICFDFSKHIQDMFLVGLEGGLIIQCSVLGANELKGHTKEEPLLDPVFKYYEPHNGEVISTMFSPNRSEMFLTTGTDLEIRIYVIGQNEPAQVIFVKKLLSDVMFIPHEEKLIAGCSIEGFIEIFNLITGKPLLNITKEKIKNKAATSAAINPWRNDKIVIGKCEGELQFWNVPWRLFAKKR